VTASSGDIPFSIFLSVAPKGIPVEVRAFLEILVLM
jgi:hypothetical protein